MKLLDGDGQNRGLQQLIVLILVVLLIACDQAKEQTIHVAYVSWPGYEPIGLAASEGMYQGVNVRTSRVGSAAEAMRAFQMAAVDIAGVTIDEAIQLQSQLDETIEIIVVTDISHGGDVIIARTEIESIADLRDKRVGVEPTALGAFFISRALESASELSLDRLIIIPAAVDQHESLFTNGKVDAIVTFGPVASRILRNDNDAHIIFDSSMIAGEIVDVLIVRSAFANANNEAVRAVVAGYFKAITYLDKYPDDAISKMAALEEVDIDDYRESLAGIVIPGLEKNRDLLSGELSVLIEAHEKLHQFLRVKQIINVAGEPHELKFTDRFLMK